VLYVRGIGEPLAGDDEFRLPAVKKVEEEAIIEEGEEIE